MDDPLSPRLEMTPLLDVVFLLLTFFIYAVTVMVQADALPVNLSGVSGGEGVAAPPQHVLSVNPVGGLDYNGEPVADGALTAQLARIRNDTDAANPTLYLALDAAGTTDRAPRVWRLLQEVQAAGITDVVIVGEPASP